MFCNDRVILKLVEFAGFEPTSTGLPGRIAHIKHYSLSMVPLQSLIRYAIIPKELARFVGLEPTFPGLRPGALINYAITL